MSIQFLQRSALEQLGGSWNTLLRKIDCNAEQKLKVLVVEEV